MKPAPKQKQGCWTCKRRKIGCDKATPSCNNCRRSGRECQGYGLRLVWPDQNDGRRARISPTTYNGYLIVSNRSSRQFLNTTFDDLHQPCGLGIYDVISRVTAAHALVARPAGCNFIYPRMLDNEPSMIQYYESRISSMISTIDTRNGFRSELLPMALASSSLASLALRNAILAVAVFHRAGATAALPFKAKAVRYLSSSLSSEGDSGAAIVNTQLAASMMLCVYSVFDETEGNWYFHLDGARAMLYHLSTMSGGTLPCHFLYSWLIYHEVLGAFTQPLQPTQQGMSSIDFLTHNADKTLIIGSLGCSLEVLEAIHRLNKIRCVTMAGHTDITEALVLERNLVTLTQRVEFMETPSQLEDPNSPNYRKPLLTAELYRVATLLYHHRVYASHLDRNQERQIYLEQAFDLLSQMHLCTSPWPLFVVASEANSDGERLLILRMLDRMDEARKIGNVFVLRDIIQSFWKQQDLAADGDGGGAQPRWSGSWDLLFGEGKRAVPWFI